MHPLALNAHIKYIPALPLGLHTLCPASCAIRERGRSGRGAQSPHCAQSASAHTARKVDEGPPWEVSADWNFQELVLVLIAVQLSNIKHLRADHLGADHLETNHMSNRSPALLAMSHAGHTNWINVSNCTHTGLCCMLHHKKPDETILPAGPHSTYCPHVFTLVLPQRQG